MAAEEPTHRLRRLALAAGQIFLCLTTAAPLFWVGALSLPAAFRPDAALPPLEHFALALATAPSHLYRDLLLALLPGHLVAVALAAAGRSLLPHWLGLELCDAADRPADSLERTKEAAFRLLTPATLWLFWLPLLLLGSGRSLAERLSRTHWSRG
jgi:hypothetical protein